MGKVPSGRAPSQGADGAAILEDDRPVMGGHTWCGGSPEGALDPGWDTQEGFLEGAAAQLRPEDGCERWSLMGVRKGVLGSRTGMYSYPCVSQRAVARGTSLAQQGAGHAT